VAPGPPDVHLGHLRAQLEVKEKGNVYLGRMRAQLEVDEQQVEDHLGEPPVLGMCPLLGKRRTVIVLAL